MSTDDVSVALVDATYWLISDSGEMSTDLKTRLALFVETYDVLAQAVIEGEIEEARARLEGFGKR